MFESTLNPQSFSTPKRPLSCAQNVSCQEWKLEHDESPHIDRSCLHGQLSRDAKAGGSTSPFRPFRLPTELLIPPPAFSSIITTPLARFSHHDLVIAARAASIQDVANIHSSSRSNSSNNYPPPPMPPPLPLPELMEEAYLRFMEPIGVPPSPWVCEETLQARMYVQTPSPPSQSSQLTDHRDTASPPLPQSGR